MPSLHSFIKQQMEGCLVYCTLVYLTAFCKALVGALHVADAVVKNYLLLKEEAGLQLLAGLLEWESERY